MLKVLAWHSVKFLKRNAIVNKNQDFAMKLYLKSKSKKKLNFQFDYGCHHRRDFSMLLARESAGVISFFVQVSISNSGVSVASLNCICRLNS